MITINVAINYERKSTNGEILAVERKKNCITKSVATKRQALIAHDCMVSFVRKMLRFFKHIYLQPVTRLHYTHVTLRTNATSTSVNPFGLRYYVVQYYFRFHSVTCTNRQRAIPRWLNYKVAAIAATTNCKSWRSLCEQVLYIKCNRKLGIFIELELVYTVRCTEQNDDENRKKNERAHTRCLIVRIAYVRWTLDRIAYRSLCLQLTWCIEQHNLRPLIVVFMMTFTFFAVI